MRERKRVKERRKYPKILSPPFSYLSNGCATLVTINKRHDELANEIILPIDETL